MKMKRILYCGIFLPSLGLLISITANMFMLTAPLYMADTWNVKRCSRTGVSKKTCSAIFIHESYITIYHPLYSSTMLCMDYQPQLRRLGYPYSLSFRHQ